MKHKRPAYIIFDGTCGFCNRTVMFIAKRDTRRLYVFVSSLSGAGKQLLVKHRIQGLETQSVILVTPDEKVYIKSMAVQRILFQLPRYKWVAYLMELFPLKFKDFIYDFISRRRMFISKNNCPVPDEDLKERFII